MQPTAQQLATTGGKAVEGAWYGGQRYMNGSLLAPGQDQAGHDVSQEVIAQTNPNNVSYVNNQRAQSGMSPSPSISNPNPNNSSTGGGGGLSGLLGGGNQPGTPNLQGIYDTAFTNNADVKASQGRIADLQSQVAARQTARDAALKDVNDNPFYSESNRVGRAAKVNESYNNDAMTLTNQLSTEQNNLTAKQAEAERQVNLATGQYNLDNQAYQQNLQNFDMMLQSGAFTNPSAQDIATISAQTGISPSMLQNMVQSQQDKMVSPQIVTSTDNEGNLSIVAVDKRTGKIINQEVLGGVGKAKGGGGGGGTSTSVTKNLVQQFGQTTSSSQGKNMNGTYVGVFPQLVAQYAPSMSLQDIYKNYANTALGKQYGTPHESAADIKQIYDYYQGKQTVN